MAISLSAEYSNVQVAFMWEHTVSQVPRCQDAHWKFFACNNKTITGY